MAHPLYKKYVGLVNKDVTIHHRNGSKYYGTIVRVTSEGIYLAPHPPGCTVANGKTEAAPALAILNKRDSVDATGVFFFHPFFFPFAVLTGFTLGFVAGVFF